MSPTEFEILENAFADVEALEGEARAAYLARFAQNHPELVDELGALMAADDAPESELTAMVSQSIAEAARDQPDPWIGRQIGSWTISARLGQGGMGAVFKAHRGDGEYDQTAALKVINLRNMNARTIARFLTERQILANLRHPNIARLIDGGTEHGDLPYLVMEYIAGERIDRHCDERQLGVSARLQLFRKVCDTVDFAHRHLVVHRDIKPSNILIDENGEPQLLDFGIAKLLEPEEQEGAPQQTTEAAQALTPEYASPEQVRGEPVTIASDIYALGVLLYRLLSGCSPYGEAGKSAYELQTAILDRDPSRPSAALSSMDTVAHDGLPDAIASQRGLTAAELRTRLKGDLDNIVLKCLQKDPERRYASARDLERDVERYLHDQPVTAGGDDLAYRARKFAKRNRGPLIAASLAVLGLVGLVSFYTARLADERDRAELEAMRSREVADFLVGIFDSADPAAAPGETVTAQMLLDAGVADVDAIVDPAIRGALLRAMGQSYGALGQYDQATDLLDRSIALFREPGNGTRLDLARSLSARATVYNELDRFEERHADAEEAVALARASYPEGDGRLAPYLGDLASAKSDIFDQEGAMATWNEAIAVQRGAGTYGDSLTSDMLGDLAVAYDNAGRYEESIATGKEALRLSDETLGRLDANGIIILNNLALVHYRMGLFDEGVEFARDALSRALQFWPGDHPQIPGIRMNVGLADTRLGNFAEAETQYDLAAEELLAAEGAGSVAYGWFLYMRGAHDIRIGRADEVRRLSQEGMAIARAVLDEDSELFLMHRMMEAVAERDLGNAARSETILRDLLAKRELLRAADQAALDLYLGQALTDLGEFAEAARLLESAFAAFEERSGPDSVSILSPLNARSQLERARGNPQAAVTLAARAERIADQSLPEGNWLIATVRGEHGRALAEAGRTAQGLQRMRSARADLVRAFGTSDSRVRELDAAIAAAGG